MLPMPKQAGLVQQSAGSPAVPFIHPAGKTPLLFDRINKDMYNVIVFPCRAIPLFIGNSIT